MNNRPRLLDLFCGAGGAAMGYHRAGFTEIVGVDIKPQPRYPFEFVQADALEYVAEHGHEFDAIHASPPCQYYSRMRYLPWVRNKSYWRSIPPTRAALKASERPWVLENVEDAGWDMPDSIVLCGQTFGLQVFRHRRFEAEFLMLQPVHQKHDHVLAHGRDLLSVRHGGPIKVMGIDWMTQQELSQAVPPAYTEYIGRELLKVIEVGAICGERGDYDR